jgi:hypothetical protein
MKAKAFGSELDNFIGWNEPELAEIAREEEMP